MLNISLGNEAVASGFCCVSVGNKAVTRGAFQVRMTETLNIPDTATEKDLNSTILALKDICLTYQAMVEQGHAPEDFGVRSKAAIDVAVDALQRRIQQLTVSTPANASSVESKAENAD